MHNINPKTLSLISTPRLDAFKYALLRNKVHYTQQELIGSYIWNQQMAACIYPLLQNLEIFLRNTIDLAARNKYGDYWWDKIDCNQKNNFFFGKIKEAKKNLDTEWKKTNKITPTLPLPTWSHDQIVAATDFSTWIFLFDKDFIKPSKTNRKKNWLWPELLGKVFHQWHKTLGHSKQQQAIIDIRNLLEELRRCRNRISHHQPTWLKAYKPMTPNNALSTIQDKITKIGKVYQLIHPDIYTYMKDNGLIDSALQHCHIDTLEMYQGVKPLSFFKLTRKQQKMLNTNLLCANPQLTKYIKHKSSVFVFKKFR